MILCVVGTGYGIEIDSSFYYYLSRFESILEITGGIAPYVLICFVAMICFFMSALALKNMKLQRYILVFTLLCFGNIFLQFVLHAKGGMWERYLIPSSVIISAYVFILSGILSKESIEIKRIFIITVAIAGVYLSTRVNDQSMAADIAKSGREISSFLTQAANLYDGGNILVDINGEYDFSVSVYLCDRYDISNVYTVNYLPTSNGKFACGYHRKEIDADYINIEDASILIAGHNNTEVHKIENIDQEYVQGNPNVWIS